MASSDFEAKVVSLEKRVKTLERKLVAMHAEKTRRVKTIKKNMLNTEEAAAYLGMESAGLRGLAYKKQITYYKPNGKNIYFDIKDLNAWLKRNRQDAVN